MVSTNLHTSDQATKPGGIDTPGSDIPPKMLRRKAAANYVQETWGFPCSQAWLAKLAVVGGGPYFRKAGRFPLYSVADLDVWANSRIGRRVSSTSDVS